VKRFSLDARSLALGRILIAALLIIDLAIRATDLEAHYTDAGVLGRDAMHLEAWDFMWSLHGLLGSTAFEALLFALGFFFAAMLLVGYRTFIATVASWLLVASLHARNPLLRDGQDDLLRVILFWCMFLPLGRRLSVDARRHPVRDPQEDLVLSAGTIGFILQMCVIYWVGAITKLESPWWTSGNGVLYSLSLARYQTAFAAWLTGFPSFLRFLNIPVEALELFGPFLLFIPSKNDRLRTLAVALFVLLHLGFAACLHLGIFPYLSCATWAMLLPQSYWDRTHRAIDPPPLTKDALRSPQSIAALASIAMVVVLNIPMIIDGARIPQPIARLGVALGLQQYWAVFAPGEASPLTNSNGWWVTAGTLEDGSLVSPFGDEKLTYERPRRLADALKNHRWRHYFANLRVAWPTNTELKDSVDKSREGFASWLCKSWNDAHGAKKRMSKVELVYMDQQLGAEEKPPIRMSMLQYSCAEGRPIQKPTAPEIASISPRMITNTTSYPVVIYGERLVPGLELRILADPPITVDTVFIDARHLTARVPPIRTIQPDLSTVELSAELVTSAGAKTIGSTRVLVVNDAQYPMPYALGISEDQRFRLYVASKTSGEIVGVGDDPKTPPQHAAVGERPRAMAPYRDAKGIEWMVVGDESGRLILLKTPFTETEDRRVIEVGADVQDVAIDSARHRVFVTSHQKDAVLQIDLDTGKLEESFTVGLDPRYLALGEHGKKLVTGNIESLDVSIVDLQTKQETRVHPGPGTPIIGGRTEQYVDQIMGGLPGRGVVYSEKLHVAFMSTLGPNVGPNADRMEVSQNGGVSVIDLVHPRYVRHVSILQGSAEGLALDDDRGLLYVADGSTGRVVVMDTKKLAESDASARSAILGAIELPVPEGTPLIRPLEDFGQNGRATVSLHFGPKSLVLDKRKTSLFVLSRFSGEILELDTRLARQGKLAQKRIWPPWTLEAQRARREGEIVYFSDLGNTRMSCDTCHPEGHVGGVLFSKGKPIRIYRAHSIRVARESPPYFTPSKLPSIKDTARRVLSRNRFRNPKSNEEEMSTLTEFVGAIAAPPNPFVGPMGELAEDMALPDGEHGNAKRGLALFEGKGGCADERCHPPPSFTADQTLKTRGLLHQLGTPVVIPLRVELQDVEENYGQPPPVLTGIWDQFPLFLSGACGLDIGEDNTLTADKHRFALRWMVENPEWSKHGGTSAWPREEQNDLLAYLLSL
jgi:DNA-binding beta-propeller fold protein YncE